MKRLIFPLIFCLITLNLFSQEDEFMPIFIEDKEAFLSSTTGEFVFREHDKTDASQLRTNNDGTVMYTEAKSHTVKKGETLFVISKKYGVSVSEIKKQNKLKTNNLSIGQQFTIKKSYVVESSKPVVKQAEGRIIARLAPGQTPGGMTPPDLPPDALPGNTINLVTDDAKPSISKPVAKETSLATNTINEVGGIIHTVKAGETLFSIAKKYKVSLNDLKKDNKLAFNTLNSGQKLKVKVYNPQMFQQNPQTEMTPKTSEKLEVVQEEVEKAEELKQETISTSKEIIGVSKVKTQEDKLIENNSEKIDDTIKEGTPVIEIAEVKKDSKVDALIKKYSKKDEEVSKKPSPKATHVVKKGETLWAISRKYNISVEELVKLNALKNNNLSIGQKLKIK